jgi:pilus assembly protein CpaF
VQLTELVSYSTVDDSWHLEREPAFIGRSVEEGLLDGEEVGRWRHSVS